MVSERITADSYLLTTTQPGEIDVAEQQGTARRVQLSEAITETGPPSFAMRAVWASKGSTKRVGSRYVSGRTRAWLKTKNPDFERR